MPNEINQQLGFDASRAIQSVQSLDKSLAQLEARLRSTAGTLGQFNKVGASFDQVGARGTAAYTRLEQNSRRATQAIRNRWEDLISVHGRYTTSLALASRIVFTQAVIRGFRQTRQAIQDAFQASLEFSRGLAEIQTISGGVLGSTNQLAGKLRDLSTRFNLSLPDTTAAAYQALSNQVIQTSGDFRFLESAARLSKAGLSTLEDSVNLLSGTLNAYNKSTIEADNLSGQFFKTVELGRLRISDLAQVFGTIAPLGRQVGVSTAELNAALATLTVRGVPVSQAATQIRGALTGLIKPSEELEKLLREMGFASAQAAVAALGFDGVLRSINQRVNGSSEALAKLFPNVRGLQGELSLGGQAAELFSQNIEKIQNASTELVKDKAMQIMASDAEQLTAKVNTLKNSLIPLGDALVTTANKGIEGLGVFRDYSFAVLQFTGDLVRGKPAVDQFGESYRNLQGLFGADLTIGESGGKIVSEIEIRERQLGIIAKRREEDQRKESAALAQAQVEQNRIRFQEIDDAKAANKQLIEAERDKLRQLGKIIKDNERLRRDSQQRIAALTQRRDDVQLRAQTADLSDPQQALALIQRAQQLASEAELALQKAARTGDEQAAQRARSLFDQADALASEAQSIAQSAGAKDRERQAGAALAQISQQQLSAEQSLSNAITARLPNLEQQQAKSKDNLATLTAAAKALQDGSSAIQAGVGPSGQIAANYERAARAAGQLSIPAAPVNRVFGGPTYLAAGGQPRGLDTIPAMLAPGEMVISAKQTRAFFSQLQAMNAGHAPVFREAGGTVNNGIIGDVSVGVTGSTYGERQTARAILGELKREIRRRGGGLL